MGKVGYLAELSVGASPTVFSKIRDASLEMNSGEIDSSSRSGAGWMEKDYGLSDWKVSGESLWVPDDTAFELLEAAFLAKTKIAVKLLDIAGAGGHGWNGTAIVTKLGRSEPLAGALVCPIELSGDGALTRIDAA